MTAIIPIGTSAYATVEIFRDEGITETQATEARLLALIDEASRLIDQVTGWFFYPGQATLLLDGRGSATIEPPYLPIEITDLLVDGVAVSIESEDLVIVGGPVHPAFSTPRLSLRGGAVFPAGRDNIEVSGVWGYREYSEDAYGRVPVEIARACKLLVMRSLPLLGDTDSLHDAQNRWRLIEERTRDQSYKLGQTKERAPLTGDPEIDRILWRYMRPSGLGAV